MGDDVTLINRQGFEKDALRRQLIVDLEQQYALVKDQFSDFSKVPAPMKSDRVALIRSLLTAVDHVLAQVDGADSLFIRNAVKPLKKIREDAESLLEELGDPSSSSVATVVPTLGKDMSAVYILLFQSRGHDLASWAQLLRSLDRYVLGRPVYKTEEDVLQVIRVKMLGDQGAYVQVGVPSSVLSASDAGSKRKDRFGNALVSLPAGMIGDQSILEFVHGNKHYHFVKGELVDVPKSTERN